MLADSYRDAVYAVRTLLKNPGFTIVAVLALALGIGANTTVYSVVDALIHFPLPVDDPDRVVFVWSEHPTRNVTESGSSMDDFLEWRADSVSFDHLVAASATEYNLVGSGEPVRVQAFRVTAGFFPLWGKTLALGRPLRPEENERGNHRVAVLSHGFWQQRFGGGPDVLGREITLDGERFTIIGVAREEFFFPSRNIAMWTPLVVEPGSSSRDDRTHIVLGRLKVGIIADAAGPDIAAIARRQAEQFPDTNEGWTTKVITVRDNLVSGATLALTLLYGSITFVMLIACANVANLLIARATSREKEMALRTSLGAGRLRLIRQLLIESLVLAASGGAIGILVGTWGVMVLRDWIAPDPNIGFIAEAIGMNTTVLAHALVLSLLAAVLFGLVPALQASTSDLRSTLKEGGRGVSGGRRRKRLRSALVVAEITMALVLLGTSGALIRAFTHIYQAHPGFAADHLLTLQLALPESGYPEPRHIAAFYEDALAALGNVPGVASVTSTTALPLTLFPGATGSPITVEGLVFEDADDGARAIDLVVSPGYFETMGVPILRGRPLRSSDTEDALPVAVVSRETVARYWPDTEPLGKRFKLGERNAESEWITVVGVSGDVQAHMHSVRRPRARAPHVFLSMAQQPRRASAVAIRTTVEPESIADAARRAVWSVDPNLPIDDVRTMEAVIAQIDTQNVFFLRVLTGLSVIALILAAIGIYGIIAFAVSQRSHEIGIRMALGARPSSILLLVLRQGALLTVAGIALGITGAILFVRFMGAELEGIAVSNASGALTYVSVSLVVLIVAKLASFIPARRAVKIDPLVTLRYE